MQDPPVVKKLESDLGSAREDLKKLREEAEGRMQQLESLRSQEKLLKEKVVGKLLLDVVLIRDVRRADVLLIAVVN